MFEKCFENAILKELKKISKADKPDWLKNIDKENLKRRAQATMIKGKISIDFYKKYFL